MRVVTRVLRRTGQRDRVILWRLNRRRSKRAAAEARGDQSLSRPSLHGMDAKLDAIIDKDGGFFVEAGANDGFTQSNTYWLERFRGWSGILVEPMPELASLARTERPDATVVEAALVSSAFEGTAVEMEFGDLMSTVSGTQADGWGEPGIVLGWRDGYRTSVAARTLSDVLDAHGTPEVDLLSLDVEGYELEVLRGLELDRHAPRFILIEMHDIDRMRVAFDGLLGPRYEDAGKLSPMDVLYRRVDSAS